MSGEDSRLKIEASKLKEVLAILKPASKTKIIPILTNVLISYQDNCLKFRTFDLEKEINYCLRLNTIFNHDPITFCVEFRILFEIISIASGEINLIIGKKQLTIQTQFSIYHIPILDPGSYDYPDSIYIDNPEQVYSCFSLIKDALVEAATFASKDTEEGIFAGVNIQSLTNSWAIAATDKRRFYINEIEKEEEKKELGESGESFDITLPASVILEIGNLLKEHEFNFLIADNRFMLESEDISIIFRAIEGDFAKYRRLIPATYKGNFSIETANLYQILKACNPLLDKKKPIIHLNINSTEIETSIESDWGDVRSICPIEQEGETLELKVNSGYFEQGCNCFKEEEQLSIYHNGPLNLLVFKTESSSKIYLMIGLK